MSSQVRVVKLSVVGASAGPFKITDDLGNTLASNLTRAQILAGVQVYVDDAARSLTVTSTGSYCSNYVSLDYTPEGGGGETSDVFSVMVTTTNQAMCDETGEILFVTNDLGDMTLSTGRVLKRYPSGEILTGYLAVAQYTNSSAGFTSHIYEIDSNGGLVGGDLGSYIDLCQ